MLHKNKFETIFIIGLLLLTASIYLLQRYSWNHSLVIDAKTAFPLQVITDNSLSNGKSTGSVNIIDNKIILDCEIIASDYAWPFCEIDLELYDNNTQHKRYGMDLSGYTSVAIHADYENISPGGIRFQMRNYNSVYSRLDDHETWKYTGIEYFSLEGIMRICFLDLR